jgi:ribosomal protein L37AE/L43A
MAKLRPYSCPECGSFLEVDREQDFFDCPFCGRHFDAVSFHGKDLLEQAGDYMRKNEFRLAREKYEFLLSKNPENFEYLYGYACALGCVSSIDKYEDPKSYSKKIETLLASDPRYASGPAGPYFQKLSEMNSLANKYAELSVKQKNMETSVLNEISRIKGKLEYNTALFVMYLFIHAFVGILVCISFYSVIGPLPFVGLLVIPFIVYWVTNKIHDARMIKLRPHYEAQLNVLFEKRKVADEMLNEVKALRALYDSAFKQLKNLKPSESTPVITFDRRSMSSFKSETAPKPKKTAICNKCGASLRLDKEKKLYICDHCGVSYDYSVFVGDSKTKADTYLRNREFGLADKRFAQILEEDPSDFNANRGRILCAGRWIGFIQIRLNRELLAVDWSALNKALDAAIKNSKDSDLDYFNELKKLTDLIYEYYEIEVKLDNINNYNDFDDLKQRRKELNDDFPNVYKRFIEIDNKYRTIKLNDLSDRPDSDIAYRVRILEVGRWNSINEINPTKPFGVGVLKKVKNAVKEAKSNASAEYVEYFTLWGTFVDRLGDYDEFRSLHLELSGEDKAFKPKLSSNPEYAAEWEDVRNRIKDNEQKDKQMRKEIDEVHNRLIEMDNKLFYAKQDS